MNSSDIEAAATAGGIVYIDTLLYDPEEGVVRITFVRDADQTPPDVVGRAAWCGVTDFTSTVHDESDHRAEFEAGLWLENLIGISERPADGGCNVSVLTDIREVEFVTGEPPRWIWLSD